MQRSGRILLKKGRMSMNSSRLGLTFKIEKRLHGKESGIHRQEQGVEQKRMNSFLHGLTRSRKITTKSHASLAGPVL